MPHKGSYGGKTPTKGEKMAAKKVHKKVKKAKK
jgi:hypothetical protein